MAVKKTKKRTKPTPKKSFRTRSRETREQSDRRPLIQGDPDEPKSGCYFCPLMPFSKDFVEHADEYKRDAQKLLDKMKFDPHVIHGRGCGSGSKWKPVDLLFVGEVPDREEDFKKAPFIGRSGETLRRAVAERISVPADRVAYTNVVRCRPPGNRAPGKTEVKCCGYELVREIQARQPKLVVALGNKSLEFLTQQSGITVLAGKVLDCTRPEFPDLKVLAAFHPAYVLLADYLLDDWVAQLDMADEYLRGEYVPPSGAGDYYVLDDAGQVEELMDAFIEQNDVVAWDTETGDLTPFQDKFPRLLCFSFSDDEGVGYVVPYDHADSPFAEPGKDRTRVTKALRKFFASDCPKIAHNAIFDIKHTRHALGAPPNNVVADTMLTHYSIDEQRGTHGLKRLAIVYTGMGDYERPLKAYISTHKDAKPDHADGSYANIPGEFLFPYAAMDTDVTLRIYRAIREEPEYTNPKLRTMAERFYPKLVQVLADMEYSGAKIDLTVVRKLDKKYSTEIAEYQKAITRHKVVRAFVQDQRDRGKTGKRKADVFEFNPGSPTQLRLILFEHMAERPIELTDKGFETLSARWKAAKSRHKDRSGPKVKFDDIVQTAIDRKEWRHFSTKADVLHEYERKGNDLCPLILKYREAGTIHSTFVVPLLTMLDAEGRVHGSYLPHGTQTGRLSSQGPNLQNIPGAAKPAYVSRFGDDGVLLQIDYSQVELRVAAAWFKDPTMIKAYRDGIDLHALTAADMHHLSMEQYLQLDPKDQKEKRTRAKRINFGTLYGGGPPALQSTLKKDGVFVTIDECKDFLKTFFKVRPALKRGIERLEEKTKKLGYLEMFTGRRRRVPEVKSEDEGIVSRALRQSVNAPIQGGASEMTLMSLCLIWDRMQQADYQSKLILTVHDSIIFDCHVDEVLEIATMAKHVMEHITELSDEVWPGIDWTWLTCPIVADCEMGHSWGAMVTFDPATIEADTPGDGPLFETEKRKKVALVRDPSNIDELWEAMEWKITK